MSSTAALGTASIRSCNKKNSSMTSFDDLIASDTPTLVDFYATWCGPCQTLMPILSQVKDHLGERLTIIKIDVDRNPQLAAQMQVRGVPTMMLFRSGKPLWRQSGVMSKDEIIGTVLEKSTDKKQ